VGGGADVGTELAFQFEQQALSGLFADSGLESGVSSDAV
jgi:hypothetical protein